MTVALNPTHRADACARAVMRHEATSSRARPSSSSSRFRSFARARRRVRVARCASPGLIRRRGGVEKGSVTSHDSSKGAHPRAGARASSIHPSSVGGARARDRTRAMASIRADVARGRSGPSTGGSRRRESRAVVRDEDDEEAAGTVGVETRWARGGDVSRVVVDSRVVVVVSRVVGRGGGVR